MTYLVQAKLEMIQLADRCEEILKELLNELIIAKKFEEERNEFGSELCYGNIKIMSNELKEIHAKMEGIMTVLKAMQ